MGKRRPQPQSFIPKGGLEDNSGGRLWIKCIGQLADKVRTSIGIKPTGRRPLWAREADVIVEIPTYVESVDPPGVNGEEMSFQGQEEHSLVGQGKIELPLSLLLLNMDGVLQGEFKGS